MQAKSHPAALPQDIEWRLPHHARSVGRARRLFREQAASWGLPEEVSDTAELLLSELTTNAYRHAKAPVGREIRARVALGDGRLLLAVTDAGEALPRPQLPCGTAESGRGLVLVQLLADKWGAEHRACGVGKTVWCELLLG
ncbi:ATP-binding protein [Streptomyces sp. NPDC050085]|uniref:ATP-binding protein n=1 Tax=Streptomyces sp. NPDC050085 TaxID=3365600 RepID=UPI0037B3E8B6